jgi:hypothetical protein
MLDSIVLIVIAAGVWGLYYAIHKGFNEVIAGLQSIDQRLSK